jgi:hypothetical protein
MSAAASALWASIVRTIVPILVGAVLGWAVALNIPLDPEFEAALTASLTLGFSGAYYIAVRLIETYVSPKLGWLIGFAKSPEAYTAESPAKHRAE